MNRDWKANPPATKEEGLEFFYEMVVRAVSKGRAKHGAAFNGHVEKRGDCIVVCWDDGHEDMYQCGVEITS